MFEVGAGLKKANTCQLSRIRRGKCAPRWKSVLSLGISTLFLPFASKGINIGGGKAEGYAYASTTSTSRSIAFSSASLPTSLRNLVLLSDTLRRRQFSRSSNMARFATHKFFASLVFAATEL